MAIEGSPKMLAQDIAEGYGCFTTSTLKKYSSQDLKIIRDSIRIIQREIRSEWVDLENIKGLKKKNMKLQRLSQALIIISTYCKKRRILI